MIKEVYNYLEQQLVQKERGNHHRLAKSASRPDTKSRMVDGILFEKENIFCTTFESAYGQPTLRRLAGFALNFHNSVSI